MPHSCNEPMPRGGFGVSSFGSQIPRVLRSECRVPVSKLFWAYDAGVLARMKTMMVAIMIKMMAMIVSNTGV